MASAQEQLYGGYTGDMSYVEGSPMTFQEFWNNPIYTDQAYHFGAFSDNPNSAGNWLANIFTGAVSSAKQAYEQYLSDYEYQRNQQAAAYANWQTKQREDSAVQRAKADYEAAGFSPYSMIVNGGNGAPSSAMAYATHKRAGDSTEQKKDDDKLLSTAMKLMALIIFKKA